MKPRYKWQPLQRGYPKPISDQLLSETMVHLKCSREEATKNLVDEANQVQLWINDIYQVARRDCGDLIHLNIRRRDGGPILRDWRHFQWIKNQLVGVECEGVELYPAESRMTDTSNKYHLWVVKDPEFRFPFGFSDRHVVYDDSGKTPGTRQRPL